MKNEKRATAARRAWERRREADEACARNIEGIDGRLLPLWEQVKARMKASAYRTREEAFAEYVHETGAEWLRVHADNAERAAEAMIAAYERADGFDFGAAALAEDAREPDYLPAATAPKLRLVTGGASAVAPESSGARVVLALVAARARLPENDAAVVAATIAALDAGHIEPHGDHGRYKLTDAGRAAIRRAV